MGIDLYYTPTSPPCRSVVMAACAVGVRLNLKLVDIFAGEHLAPEYLKINPQHNVPAIDDNGFRLNESRAICIYLVRRYGQSKANHLYPEDPKQRAVVDQRLYFDATVLFPNFRELYGPIVMGMSNQLDPSSLNRYHEGLAFLNGLLSEHNYAAANHLTIADIALMASVAAYHATNETVLDEYPKIKSWFARCEKEIEHYDELNGAGARLQGRMIQSILQRLDLDLS